VVIKFRNIRLIIVLFFVVFGVTKLLCQEDNSVHYYLNKIRNSKNDTVRLNAYAHLTEYCDLDDIPIYADEALKLSSAILYQTKDNKLIYNIMLIVNGVKNNYAYYYYEKGNYKKAISIWNEVINSYDSLRKYHNDDLTLLQNYAEVMNNIASTYESMGLVENAIKLYFESLKIAEYAHNLIQESRTLNNLGFLFKGLNEYDKSLKMYHKALKIKKQLQDSAGIALLLNNIASVYLDMRDEIEANRYYLKSLSIYERLNNEEGIATVKCNLGKSYTNLKFFSESKEYLYDAWNIYLKMGKEIELISVFNDLSNLFLNMAIYTNSKNYLDSCIKYSKKAEWLSLKNQYINSIKDTYSYFFKAYWILNNFQEALKYHLKQDSIIGLLNKAELQKKALKQELEYEYEKNLTKKQLEHIKEKAVIEERNQKQKIIIIFVVIAFGLSLIVVFLVYKSFRTVSQKNQIISQQKEEVEKQKKIIELKQKDILDSIHYSKLIQKSILPHRRDIWRALPQSFVIYKPKDIVAGDFYWFHLLNEKECLIAVADCTGHGVPGAFMSILNNDKLNESVNYTNEVDEILYHVNINVKKTLKQFEKNTVSKDGMDIILVKLPYKDILDNKEPIKIEFAGANRPLFVYYASSKVVEEIKTTKASIGGFTEDNQVFEKQTLLLHKNDTIYLTTDGYLDQFGGNKNKKLMSSRFKELIASIGHLHYQEQKLKLIQFFDEWKGNNAQIDDVCIIGIKI